MIQSFNEPTQRPLGGFARGSANNDQAAWRGRDNNYCGAWLSLSRTSYKHLFSSMTEWNLFDMSSGIDLHTAFPETGRPE